MKLHCLILKLVSVSYQNSSMRLKKPQDSHFKQNRQIQVSNCVKKKIRIHAANSKFLPSLGYARTIIVKSFFQFLNLWKHYISAATRIVNGQVVYRAYQCKCIYNYCITVEYSIDMQKKIISRCSLKIFYLCCLKKIKFI